MRSQVAIVGAGLLQSHHLDFVDLVGRSVTAYGQT